MKILTVVGARPQFIKSAPVSQALHAAGLREVVLHTGQHYDATMSAVFFEELGLLPAAYNLGVGSGPHGEQTGRMLEGIEKVALAEQPDWVLVYGDTNSTLAGALAAAKLHIPVAHVEAGLRSFNRRMAEEINRILVDHISTLLFAPTEVAAGNLAAEGIATSAVRRVGDVMYDSVLLFCARAQQHSRILKTLLLEPRSYVLVTVHRAENTDSPAALAAIFAGLVDLCRERRVVLPLHPRMRAVLDADIRTAFAAAGAVLTEPVGYLDMLQLECNAALIVTDSGGVQKEAFFHRVPCVTLRDETEWSELVALGWNTLLPPARAHLLRETALVACQKRTHEASPYGDGRASWRIAACLAESGCGQRPDAAIKPASVGRV